MKYLNLLDTNIVILYLQGDPVVVAKILKVLNQERKLAISALTVTELLSYPKLNKKQKQDILTFITCIKVVPIGEITAIKAADLRRKKKLQIGDALIAATALVEDAKLLTRDKHFTKLKDDFPVEII